MTDAARHYIAGSWVAGDGPLCDSLNPADGTVLGQYQAGSAARVEDAAGAARDAFLSTNWSASPRQRAQALFEFADRLSARKDDIADLVVAENGKLRAEAMGETLAAISEARYYGGLARNIRGGTQETQPGNYSLFLREPVGVVAIIVPWNAPSRCSCARSLRRLQRGARA